MKTRFDFSDAKIIARNLLENDKNAQISATKVLDNKNSIKKESVIKMSQKFNPQSMIAKQGIKFHPELSNLHNTFRLNDLLEFSPEGLKKECNIMLRMNIVHREKLPESISGKELEKIILQLYSYPQQKKL